MKYILSGRFRAFLHCQCILKLVKKVQACNGIHALARMSGHVFEYVRVCVFFRKVVFLHVFGKCLTFWITWAKFRFLHQLVWIWFVVVPPPLFFFFFFFFFLAMSRLIINLEIKKIIEFANLQTQQIKKTIILIYKNIDRFWITFSL